MAKWIATNFPGVRYRQHLTRRHGVKFDKYFTIRYKLNGKDKEESCGWASRGITAQKAATRLGELKENQRIGKGALTLQEKRQAARRKREAEELEKKQTQRDALTFSQVWSRYFPIAEGNKTAGTMNSEKWLYNHWIKPSIGDRALRDILPIHLERLKKTMFNKGKAPRSIHYALAVVRQVFNFAWNVGLYNGDNPVLKVKKPTADNRRLRFLTHEEADKLLEALALRSTEVHDMALISLHAGLRFGEVAGLTWGDVDINKRLMVSRDTKTGKDKISYMTVAIKKVFEAKQQGKNNDHIFPGRNGLKKVAISNVFSKTVDALGLNEGITDRRQKLVYHSMRHSYASWLVEAGVDLYKVKALMGHSTISQTERYSHLAPGSLRNAVKVFEEDMHKRDNVIKLRKAEVK